MNDLVPCQVAVYGLGIIQQNVEILLHDVEVMAYISTTWDKPETLGRDDAVPIYCGIEAFSRGEERDFFVILATDRYAESVALFEKHGYIYGASFIHAFDLVERYNNSITSLPYIVMGTGGAMHTLFRLFPRMLTAVPYLLDNNPEKAGKVMFGKTIFQPGQKLLHDTRQAPIIITPELPAHYEQIADQLSRIGLVEFRDFFSAKYLMSEMLFPASVFRQVLLSPKKYKLNCEHYTNLLLITKNDIEVCCFSDFKKWGAGIVSPKVLMHECIQKAWDSFSMRVYKLMLLNKSFALCSKEYCGIFSKAETCENISIDVEAARVHMKQPPKYICFDLDKFCNLTCPACRNHNDMNPRVKQTAEAVRILLQDIDIEHLIEVEGATAGELLVSDTNLKYITSLNLKAHPAVRFVLKTNGTLIHTSRFRRLLDTLGKLNIIISIDGATKPTFEQLRRGANFERVMRNLAYIGELHRNGKVESFEIITVVQQANLHELRGIVELAKVNGANILHFIRIRELAMAEKTADSVDVYNVDHPFHDDLVRIYNDLKLHSAPTDELRIFWKPELETR